MPFSLVCLASGKGSNVMAIMRAIDDGRIDARLALILSNNPGAGILEYARERGVPTFVRDHKQYKSREDFDRELIEAINAVPGEKAIVLAGYMRILTSGFTSSFAGRIVNIHPSVLPSFPGARGGPDALAHGVKMAGCTVHFVDEILDNGPIIIQAAVPVSTQDSEESLMLRIHALEHIILPQALAWMAQGRLRVNGRRVDLLNKDKTAALPATAKTAEGPHGPFMISPAPDPEFWQALPKE